MVLVVLLELLHVICAISKVPLYTHVEMTAAYMHGVRNLTDTQIIFTYILAWTGIFLAILNVCIMHHLVHACQDLHSNVHLVLGYDQ